MTISPASSPPPTPALSLDCGSQRSSLVVPLMRRGKSYDTHTNCIAGPSRRLSVSRMTPELPLTPPEPSGHLPPIHAPDKQAAALSFAEPIMPSRRRSGRRPPSGYPVAKRGEPGDESRESRDDASDQLNVDIDLYSVDIDGSETDEPTLSYAPSSMYESTTGTPSTTTSHASHLGCDAKPGDAMPIKLRAPGGRSQAYSSAESSVVSSASLYSPYPSVHHPHPPPVPSISTAARRGFGLGVITHDLDKHNDGELYSVPRWRQDIVNRSATPSAVSLREQQADIEHSANVPWEMSYDYHAMALWDETEAAQSHATAALATAVERQEKILDMPRLLALGELNALSEEDLQVFDGVTHLLLPSVGSDILLILSPLLAAVAPSLVVLDLSDNDLTFVPEELQHCGILEELNVSNNPLRQLPKWIGSLTSLHTLQLDICCLHVLPEEMAALENLHTLSIRRNRLVVVPAWIHFLDKLSILRLDDNWLAPQWQAIVAPLLQRRQSTLSTTSGTRSSSPSEPNSVRSPRATVAISHQTSDASQHGGQRITTTVTSGEAGPSGQQAAHNQSSLGAIAEDAPVSAPIHTGSARIPMRSVSSNTALRKMRSAGDLLSRMQPNKPARPPHARAESTTATRGKSSYTATNGMLSPASSVYSPMTAPASVRVGHSALSSSPRPRQLSEVSEFGTPVGGYQSRPESKGSSSGRSGKWGFLRKMSMNKLRPEKENIKVILLQEDAADNVRRMPVPPVLKHMDSDPVPLSDGRPAIPPRSASAVPLKSAALTSEMESTSPAQSEPPPSSALFGSSRSVSRGKGRSFLSVDGPPSLTLDIQDQLPLITQGFFSSTQFGLDFDTRQAPNQLLGMGEFSASPEQLAPEDPQGEEERYTAGLALLKSYLRDLYDLGRPTLEPYGALDRVKVGDFAGMGHDSTPTGISVTEARHNRRSTTEDDSTDDAEPTVEDSSDDDAYRTATGKSFKDNRHKRARVLREIYETERTYVRGLGELVSIYVKSGSQVIGSTKGAAETVIPLAERKAVFGGIESILSMHRENLLPALERAVRTLIEDGDDESGNRSIATAHRVGEVFRTYIAYMKQYSSYVNNFDTALTRMKEWSPSSALSPLTGFSSGRAGSSGPSVSAAAVGMGMGMGGVSVPVYEANGSSGSGSTMSTHQRKRVKAFMKKCKEHPMHNQINLEAYLLLPIQRVPRYRLLLEDLALCTPPADDRPRDTLDDALAEIASLASLINEEKRDAESRLRLFNWQQRLTVKFQSPLVQPHRKLVLDGPLNLIRLAKKETGFVEIEKTIVAEADTTIGPHSSEKMLVPVDLIKPEPMDKEMTLILCSDMMVLVTKHGETWDGPVDLFSVLRMGTLREPASMVNQEVMRVVDNRSIYYFSGADPATTLQWCRAINSAKLR